MKVLFLYVSTNMCRDGDLWYYDEGFASVVACLRRAGHRAAFLMVGGGDDPDAILAWVARKREERTLVVFLTSLLFSAYGHDLPETLPTVARIKQSTGLPVAFAGLWATMNPETAIAYPGVDFVGRGELDEALVELCDALAAGRPARDVRNFWVKEDGRVHRNELRPLVPDLAELPFPARDLAPPAKLANECDGILTVVALRGCPMSCGFCSNVVMQRLYAGRGPYTRVKPVPYLIQEIRAALAADPGLRAVFFHDDIFGLTAEWTAELLERYPGEVGLPFGCNLVIGQARPAFARALRSAGCRQVQIGVESGCAYLRSEVLGKQIADEEIARALRVFREAGISVKLFAMTGLPEETRSRYLESVRTFARHRPDMIQIQVWEAHEGSDLLDRDPGAAVVARRHYRPGSDRRAWRIKFFFHHFHRIVALFEALEARVAAGSRRAIWARRLADLLLRFPWLPEVVQPRDWDGRARWPARLIESGWTRQLAGRVLGRFLADVRDRERRLASVVLWPEDVGPPPEGSHWLGAGRVDGRGAQAQAGSRKAGVPRTGFEPVLLDRKSSVLDQARRTGHASGW